MSESIRGMGFGHRVGFQGESTYDVIVNEPPGPSFAPVSIPLDVFYN